MDAAEQMAGLGLRVLALAERRWHDSRVDVDSEVLERGLTLIGLVGIGDPIRPEALEALETCRNAGIRTLMITGDHPATASAIGRQLGLVRDGGGMLTGRELSRLSDDELAEQVGTANVYARVAPEQKLRIVRALQARGHLVAMTGDGVNDAPALKQAEIGVAMGITGTDVAKQASALILLDDNFATIVRATEEGRKIYDNLRRFVRFAVTTNASEVLTMLIAPLVGLPFPLRPLQIDLGWHTDGSIGHCDAGCGAANGVSRVANDGRVCHRFFSVGTRDCDPLRTGIDSHAWTVVE
jgi:Ca2+-transporting ATPase